MWDISPPCRPKISAPSRSGRPGTVVRATSSLLIRDRQPSRVDAGLVGLLWRLRQMVTSGWPVTSGSRGRRPHNATVDVSSALGDSHPYGWIRYRATRSAKRLIMRRNAGALGPDGGESLPSSGFRAYVFGAHEAAPRYGVQSVDARPPGLGPARGWPMNHLAR
jgi:hypothetical protein